MKHTQARKDTNWRCASRAVFCGESPKTTDTRENLRLPSFTPLDAQAVWSAAHERARDDRFAEDPEDREVYRYLSLRGLPEAWEYSAVGILVSTLDLPALIKSWPGSGYRLVLPLHAVSTGEVLSVQARSVRPGGSPKTLFPPGSVSRGTVLATAAELRVLRGEELTALTVMPAAWTG